MEEQRCYYPGAPSFQTTGMVISSRDTPPAHFCCRIESLKLLSDSLSKCGTAKHEMDSFESSGFRWKLSLYPSGDKKRNGEGHLSLYLVLADADSFTVDLQVMAIIKLFLYDHIRAQYLVVEQDVSGASGFSKLKSEVGFSRFIPLSTLNNSSSGFKEGESCVFGAEVFVTDTSQKIAKEICMSTSAPSQTFSCMVELPELLNCECYYDCPSFQARGRKWFIRLQKHTSPERKRYVRYALVLAERTPPSSIIMRWRRSRIGVVSEHAVYVTGTMRIEDQVHGNHIERNFCKIYTCPKIGDFQKLLKMDHLNDTSRGYVANGKIKVGVHFSAIMTMKASAVSYS